MIRSALRARRGQILEGTQADAEDDVGGWLAPPSRSGGLCAKKRDRKRDRETEREEVCPPSTSSDTSDIAGSLE